MCIPLAKDLLTVSCQAKEKILQEQLTQAEVKALIENLSAAMLKSAESGHFGFTIILHNEEGFSPKVLEDNFAALVSDSRFTGFEKYQKIVSEYLTNLGYKVSFGSGRIFEICWE